MCVCLVDHKNKFTSKTKSGYQKLRLFKGQLQLHNLMPGVNLSTIYLLS